MSWNAAVAGAAAFLAPGVVFGATPDRGKCMNVVAVVVVVAVVGAHGSNRLVVAAGAVFGRVTYYHYHYHYYHSL